MYREKKFLLSTTALYLGIKTLEDKKVLVVTDSIKKELFRSKEFFRRDIASLSKDANAMRLYQILDGITIGAKT